MNTQNIQLLLLAMSLIGYSLLHSWLASLRSKQWLCRRWPWLVPRYRLLFNALAALLLIPPAWLLFSFSGPALWQWSGYQLWLANGVAVLALGCFAHSLSCYDMGVFLGLKQWREGGGDADGCEGFRVSFWHRFVRHPWYFFLLLVLWSRQMNAAWLLLCCLITLYLIVGSRLEEGRLIVVYGDIYRHYRARVAGLIPLPWRCLSAAEARALEQRSVQRVADENAAQ